MEASTHSTQVARGGGEALRCPRCRALNHSTASWCGQCLEPLVRPSPATPEEAPASGEVPAGDDGGAPEARPATVHGPGVFQVGPEGISWTCRVCDNANPFELRSCAVCGATLADSLREPEAEPVARDPGKAGLLSLLLPGAGHAYLGQWGQAIARAVTSLWVVFVTVATAAEQGLAATPVVFALASLGLWAAAGHDAYRDAQGRPDAVLLKGRTFFYVVLGLIGLSVVMILVTAVSLRSA